MAARTSLEFPSDTAIPAEGETPLSHGSYIGQGAEVKGMRGHRVLKKGDGMKEWVEW